MALQLKVSNSLESLAELLASKIKNNHDVFRPVYIVTQTEGMNNWLRSQIAERVGIAANLQFAKPNDIVHFSFQTLGGSYVKPISAHDLTWLLFEILEKPDFKNSYPKIAKYYDKQLGSEVKRIALATKVADLFDQYQVYRAELIAAWNEDKYFYSREKPEVRFVEKWQRELWRRAKEIAKKRFPDKNYIGSYILKSLDDPEKAAALEDRFPRIFFFGLSLITEYHLQIFSKLAEHIEVDFLIQNPAPLQYWYDDKTQKVIEFLKRKNVLEPHEESRANPLLVTWGKLTQDIFRMLFNDDEILNTFDQIGVQELPTDTLLHTVQNSIFHNLKEETFEGTKLNFSDSQIMDESITINSCFSPRREVEVLYNYLVHLIDKKNETLSARDIVVMVPDIDTYAPYIKAVFDQAPYPFYYTISDKNEAESDTIANALMEILSLTDQQFTSEKVVGLLSYSSVRENFEISDVDLIRRLVDAANIRFGITGDKREETHYVSWRYGLQRIIYGLCMSGDRQFGQGVDGFYPVDLVEGFDMQEATRFVYFVQVLIESLKLRDSRRTIKDWVTFVEDTISTFIGDKDSVDDEEYIALFKQLERYNVVDSLFHEQVSFEVFSHDFLPSIEQAERNKVFISGGITFCSLIPMRSIPFKVVALLGLNFDQFPRMEKHSNFDLMQLKKQKGDRNLKENDKHLFLETLLSAKDYFYVSYVGQNIKDNSALLPSILIDELLDFIATKTEHPDKTREEFVQKHPLHNFSNRYNNKNPERLFSYLLEVKGQALKLEGGESEKFNFKAIEIYDWIRFLRNPFKGFYNSVLNIYYRDEDLMLDETEVFSLDHLQNWKLKNDLLGIDDVKPYVDEGVKKGFLPLRNMKNVVVAEAEEEIAELKENYKTLRGGFPETVFEIDLEVDDSHLSGKIDRIYNGKMIRVCSSKNSQKYKLMAYLEYLVLAATNHPITVCLLTKTEGILTGQQIEKTEALSCLQSLVTLYKSGFEKMIPVPEGFTWPPKEANESGFQKAVERYYEGFPDQYFKKEFENGFFKQEGIFEEFQTAADLMILPATDFFKPTN